MLERLHKVIADSESTGIEDDLPKESLERTYKAVEAVLRDRYPTRVRHADTAPSSLTGIPRMACDRRNH